MLAMTRVVAGVLLAARGLVHLLSLTPDAARPHVTSGRAVRVAVGRQGTGR